MHNSPFGFLCLLPVNDITISVSGRVFSVRPSFLAVFVCALAVDLELRMSLTSLVFAYRCISINDFLPFACYNDLARYLQTNIARYYLVSF